MDTSLYQFGIDLILYRFFPGGNWIHPNCATSYWRLYWHKYDEASVELSGKKHLCTPDIITMIPPHTPFDTYGTDNSDHFYIHFFAGFPFNLFPPHIFQIRAEKRDISLIQKIVKRDLKGLEPTPESSLSCISLCADYLGRLPYKGLAENAIDHRIIQMDAYMGENIHRSVSNEEFAKLVYMAPNSFNRFFKQETGLTPQQYFTRKKTDQASIMLQYYNMSIEDIAERLGFCDRYYFSKAFKKVTGYSPAAYRKESRLRKT